MRAHTHTNEQTAHTGTDACTVCLVCQQCYTHHTHLHEGLYDTVDQFNVVFVNVTVEVLQKASHLSHKVHIVDVVWLHTKVVLRREGKSGCTHTHSISYVCTVSMDIMLPCEFHTSRTSSEVGSNFERSWNELQVKLDGSWCEIGSNFKRSWAELWVKLDLRCWGAKR